MLKIDDKDVLLTFKENRHLRYIFLSESKLVGILS
jgi:hypothetical protein